MGIKFSDIEDAFLFVSMSPMYTNHAILCKETGKIYYASEYGDDDEIPEEIFEDDDCLEIPNKNDLDLGQHLVFEFVEENLPNNFDHVKYIFRKKGAYGRYKDFLEERGLLEKWYEFENQNRKKTLLGWCQENEIILESSPFKVVLLLFPTRN